MKQVGEIEACVAQSIGARIVELRKVLELASSPGEKQAVISPQMSPASAPKRNADCSDANPTTEPSTCGDPTLRHWEDMLTKLYQQAMDDSLFRTVLADDQQRWIGERSGACGGLTSTKKTNCVLQMTKRRIEQFVQFINSRDEPEDRSSKVEKILSGKTTPPPGLDADSIDRESARADQSELILADARTCIKRNVGVAEASNEKQVVALVSAACFPEFSRRLSALELGTLAKPSFETLVHQELNASR